MPVRSHEEHAIVCQRQGVTLVLATSMQATRLQRPLADEHVEEGRRQSPAITIAAIVPTAVSICGANNAPVARTIVGGSIVTRRVPFGDIAGLARMKEAPTEAALYRNKTAAIKPTESTLRAIATVKDMEPFMQRSFQGRERNRRSLHR
jgi:hypothetical protein